MNLIQTAFLYYAVISMEESVIGFNQRCPGQNEWHFRRKNCTTPDKPFYTCLYNEYSFQYSENCTRQEYESRKGKKVVISPGISESDCADSRFQPFKFTTHGFSDCIYAKSTCSEEGQLLVKNGSNLVDRSCRCDYRKGYNYITQPKDTCSCVPSQEDCSCYLTNCTRNSALTQDYDCVLKIGLGSGPKVCGKILDGHDGSPAYVTTTTNDNFVDNKVNSSTSALTSFTSILIGMFITVVFILMLLVALNIKVVPHIVETKGISEKDRIIYEKPGTLKTYHVIEGDNFTIASKMRSLFPVKSVRLEKDGDGINYPCDTYELNDSSITKYTIENISEADTGTYTCIVSNWLGLNNTTVDRCVSYLSNLHGRMTWIQTLHQFHACRKEDQNSITVIVHKLPTNYEPEEKKIGDKVKMKPLKGDNKGTMQSSGVIKSVVWFYETEDIVRIVEPDKYGCYEYGDIADGAVQQSERIDKNGAAVKADKHCDTKDGAVKADQHGDTEDGTVKADQHGGVYEGAVKAEHCGDTNDDAVKAEQHGDTNYGAVKAKHHGDTKDGAVKAEHQGDTKDGAVKAEHHCDTKDEAVKADQHGDTKDGVFNAEQHCDIKDEAVKADQHGDTKHGAVKAEQYCDTKDEAVKADQHFDTKDGVVKAEKHEDSKDEAVKAQQHGDAKFGDINDEGFLEKYALNFITAVSHNGQYVCFVVTANGNIFSYGWKLKVFPQGSVYKEVIEHRKDKSYIKTSTVEKAMEILKNNGFVVIVGREGTGKSKISLQLASLFEEKGYLPFKVDKDSLHTTQIANLKSTKFMFIIDHSVYDPNDLGQILDQVPEVSNISHIRIIFTCRHLQPFVKKTLQTNNLYNDKALIVLDKILTVDDKRKILAVHMRVNNIAQSKDKSKPVGLDEDVITEIIKTEPYFGFPLMASNFCSQTENLKKGGKYFTNPPKFLVDEIRDLYQSAWKSKEPELVNQYLVLVYLATNERVCFDVSVSSATKVMQVNMLIYGKIKEVEPYEMSSIKDAADKLVAIYKYITKSDDQTYRFIHPYVSKAIFLSSDNLLNHFIQKGDVENIIEFVKSFMYTVAEDELVLKLQDDKLYHILCERLTEKMTEKSDLEEKIGHYIYDNFIKIRDTSFLQALLSKLKCISSMQNESPVKHVSTNDKQTATSVNRGPMGDNYDKTNLKRNEEAPAIKLYSPPQMIAMIEHLTSMGKDSWIYEAQTTDFPDFVVLYGLIVGCKNKFLSDAKQGETFQIILNMFVNSFENQSFRLKCYTPMDTFDNKFCHFLTLFNEYESFVILKKLNEGLHKHAMKDTISIKKSERKNILKVKNIFKESPLQIAAYLGKAELFNDFSSGSKKKKKKREKLYEVVKNGMEVAFVTSNFTNLNFDHDLRKSICFGEKEAYDSIFAALKKW